MSVMDIFASAKFSLLYVLISALEKAESISPLAPPATA